MIEDQELIDTFRMAGEMITKAQQTAEQALELAQKIVMSMSDAVMGQRKGTFQELLGQHSADIAPIDQFYSDTFGNSYSDQLISELLDTDPENPDEFINSKIGEERGKYGKYLGAVAPPEPEIESPIDGEPVAEGEKGKPEAPAAEVSVEVEKKPKSKKPGFDEMVKTLGLKTGK